jgi:LytS/YehU family sensor histidine kinase
LAPEEYKRKLSLVQVKDQLEIQKKEAQLLSNQNQISQQQIKLQESALKRNAMLLYISIAALLVMGLLAILVNRNIKLKRRKLQLQQLMEQVNAQQKLTELEIEKTHLEMQALRAQMNPHFIFNCLSSINLFILINKIDEASDYLTKFSRLIRMALHNSEKPLIPLESELEALRLYLDLERLRFKNAFNYSITFINNIDINAVFIPPMLIQPFAENSIWHGLMHKKGVGCLEIQLCAHDKMLTCAVIDNGIGRKMAASFNSRSAAKNKSMGVEITTGRLALINKSRNEAAIFHIEDLRDENGLDCGTRVVLNIPYKDLTEVIS